MTYRDETESLRAKVATLEERLAESDAQVARLRGEAPATPSSAAAAPDRLVGETIVYDDTVELPFRISERGYEAIAALLAERLGISAAQVGSSLKGGLFALTCEGDTTRITLRTDLRGLRGAVWSGGFLTLLFGGLPTLGVIMDATHGGMPAALHALWALPVAMAGGTLAMRRVAAKRAREGRAKHQGTLAAVLDLAHQHRLEAPGAAGVRVRVAEVHQESTESMESAESADSMEPFEAAEPLLAEGTARTEADGDAGYPPAPR